MKMRGHGSAAWAHETRLRRSGLVRSRRYFDWIAKDNPIAAKAVVERIFASVEHLAEFPQMGHAGRDGGSFEWVVPRLPYIVVYEIHRDTDEVIIVGVVHGARDREAE